MSRSLSWIEESALTERLSELVRPSRSSGLPVPEPASERPSPYNGGASGEYASPYTYAALQAGNVPTTEQSQDPWSLTPVQPWTAVVTPSRDAAPPGIPELTYPRSMALAARLELFRDWIREYCGDGAFFVSDPEGLPLLLERVRTSQAVTAVALERALHPLRGLLGSSRANALCIELEDGRLVQIVWATTDFGRIAVGLAPTRPLAPAATSQVRRALLGLFEDEDAL